MPKTGTACLPHLFQDIRGTAVCKRAAPHIGPSRRTLGCLKDRAGSAGEVLARTSDYRAFGKGREGGIGREKSGAAVCVRLWALNQNAKSNAETQRDAKVCGEQLRLEQKSQKRRRDAGATGSVVAHGAMLRSDDVAALGFDLDDGEAGGVPAAAEGFYEQNAGDEALAVDYGGLLFVL